MSYRAPVSEIRFLFDHVVGFDQVAATERFSEATPETVAAVLSEAGKMCEDILSPLQRSGDLHPARLENGIVRTSPPMRNMSAPSTLDSLSFVPSSTRRLCYCIPARFQY